MRCHRFTSICSRGQTIHTGNLSSIVSAKWVVHRSASPGRCTWPLVTNETSNARHDLLHLLGYGGTNAAKLAGPIVIASLEDRKWDIRVVAAQALARWESPRQRRYRSCSHCSATRTIKRPCRQRWLSAESPIAAMRQVPGLRRLLESTNDYIRGVAAMTLWRLGGDASETRQILEPLLTSKRGKGNAASF